MPKRIKLSSRLNKIYEQLKTDQPVWDLCCDHGLLGTKAYLSARFPEVHFVDAVAPIIQKLERKFQQKVGATSLAEHPSKVFFWAAKAGELQVPVRGNIVIAGVGATTILEILAGLQSGGFLQAERLLLCPQNRPDEVRLGMQAARSDRYVLKLETEVLEKSRLRHLFIYDRP